MDFKHKTGNAYGDWIGATRSKDDGYFWLNAGDDSEAVSIVCNRSDLDAIIEKLTALRDGVGE